MSSSRVTRTWGCRSALAVTSTGRNSVRSVRSNTGCDADRQKTRQVTDGFDASP